MSASTSPSTNTNTNTSASASLDSTLPSQGADCAPEPLTTEPPTTEPPTTEPPTTEPSVADLPDAEPLRIRYRIRFAKRDLLRWISHRDLALLWERIGRRAMLNFSMTQGFHPRARISFPTALALGIESDDEVVEIELVEPLTPTELMRRLIADHQPGLTIRSVAMIPAELGKAQIASMRYVAIAPDSVSPDDIARGIERVNATPTITREKKGKRSVLDLRRQIQSLTADGQTIHLSLAQCPGANLRVIDILDLMELADFIAGGGTIRRTGVSLENEFESSDIAERVDAGPVQSLS